MSSFRYVTANPFDFYLPTSQPMGFGTLNLPIDKEVDDEAFSVLKTASDCGINFVDTAEAVSSKQVL